MVTVLVTVPDEGAAATVCEALAEAGLAAEAKRSWRRHAYQPSALATPFDVLVDEADAEAARAVLRRLAEENVTPLESTDHEERAAGEARWWRRPSPWVAVIVALIPVVPLACFYAGARRMGALFAGVTLTAFVLMFGQGGAFSVGAITSPYPMTWHGWLRPRSPAERVQGERSSQTPLPDLAAPEETAHLAVARTLTAAKLGDLVVALWFIRRERRRRAHFSTNARSMT